MPVPDVTPDPPSRSWRAVLALLRRLPQAGLSRSLGHLADLPLPRPLRRPVLRAFAAAFGIDRSEAAEPLDRYGSINAFFVRRLRPGLRTFPDDPSVVGSPVDGVVGQVGTVREGRVVQAKGRTYDAGALLDDPDEGARFEGGLFATLYLSPRHYHRIHAPTGGAVAAARHVPGRLLPVNAAAVAHVEDLFPRNERLVALLDGPVGRVAVVAVGAYNVGRISAAFDPGWAGDDGRPWVTNRKAPPPRERSYDPPVAVEAGDEIMAFHLGSTVVLLFEPGRVSAAPGLEPGAEVRLGDPLAH